MTTWAKTLLVGQLALCGLACDQAEVPDPAPDPLVEALEASRAPAASDCPPGEACAAPPGAGDYGFWRAQARREEGTAAAVSAHVSAARAALPLHQAQPDGGYLDRARKHLREASRRGALPGACEAALELARVEARIAVDPAAAYREAYALVARFRQRSRDDDCVAEGRRMLVILEAFRPSAGVLAPIDADPHADDPSAGVAATGGADGTARDASAVVSRLEVFTPQADPQAGVARARVVVHLVGETPFRRAERAADGEHGRRALLYLERAQIAPDVPRRKEVGEAGLVAVEIRHGAHGEAQVEFQLTAFARYRAFTMTDPLRLVFDVEQSLQGRRPTSRRAPLVLLDPGHGGDDYGTRAYEMTEADLALDITRRVRSWLRRLTPAVRVRLTRDTDVLLSLEERAAMANALSADLFVSVHLNAASERVNKGGVATFVLDTENQRNVLRLAARENGTRTKDVSKLQFLVGSLARAEQVSASREAARLVQRGTLLGGRRFLPELPDRGVKSAMFYVLVGAQMPAILVEASFLTQPDEAAQLARPVYRDALAEGIARGIVRFLQRKP